MDREDLHPYDGKERRFSDDDVDSEARERGRALVARLLKLPTPPCEVRLRYDLSFYSGGIGVLDRLHVAMPCSPSEVSAIVAGLGMLAPAALRTKDSEAFEWLVLDEDSPAPSPDAAVAAFVDAHRLPFQPQACVDARTWFSPDSDVNAWSLIYEVNGELAFIAYEQG